MEHEYILSKLRKVEILPTFPGIVGEVINIIEDPMSSAVDLAKTMDPSMAGEVLRVANTAYFGTRNFRHITSIEHAIAIVGLEHLSNIVLHMPFVSMIKGHSGFDRDKFVRHSILSALMAKTISISFERAEPDEVYISGLLHDIGSIIMYRYFHDEWEKICTLASSGGLSRLQAETEVLSVHHGVLGAMALEMWNIPKTISDGVMYHHNPDDARDNPDYARVIYMGNKFAKRIDLGDNLSSFDEFMNKYKDLMDMTQDFRIELTPTEKLRFFERLFTQSKAAKGFFEGMSEEDHDQSPCC
ncbi:MAG TPA: HDOD domain-containing protein [Syntrophorhabdaceae bacterium]|nr:HDOD domain-containing protein [Syntrophorhabdaceae bacterium]